jgi:membrane peptidoglycan carboxypeptidase
MSSIAYSSSNTLGLDSELCQPTRGGGCGDRLRRRLLRVDQVVNTARKLGAPPWLRHLDSGRLTQDDPPSSFGPSLTLGGYPETPLQMATGVATIAGMGLYHPATSIFRITDRVGNPLYTYDPAQVARQVLDPKVAYIMQTIMSTDDNWGTPSAGTRRSHCPDGLSAPRQGPPTTGRTPGPSATRRQWPARSGFGNADWTAMQREFDAIFAAAPAWQSYMKQALDVIHEPPDDWFAAPPGLVRGSGNVCLLPGTSQRQPPPPLPPWARLDTSKPKDANNSNNNG